MWLKQRKLYLESAAAAATAAKSLQSCLTLCNPIEGSPPGSLIPGILQARTLEWVAISFSNTWKWKVKVKSLSHVWLLATPWTAAHQAPPSMGFSRQEYWSGVPLPSPLFFLPLVKDISSRFYSPRLWWLISDFWPFSTDPPLPALHPPGRRFLVWPHPPGSFCYQPPPTSLDV